MSPVPAERCGVERALDPQHCFRPFRFDPAQWFGLSAAALPYVLPYIGSPRYADQVCMLMPTKVGVNLGIA